MQINIWAVLVSAVVSMVIGSIWYGPLFGKMFMEAMGMNTWTPERQAEEKKKMGLLYFGQFVASLVMFYVLAWFMGSLGEITVNGGLKIAALAWVGFVVPVQLGSAIWGGKKVLFLLGAGNMLVTLLVVGAILGAWR